MGNYLMSSTEVQQALGVTRGYLRHNWKTFEFETVGARSIYLKVRIFAIYESHKDHFPDAAPEFVKQAEAWKASKLATTDSAEK